ncbi:MAG: inositol monophosphatase family protein [bacterium]
MLIEQNKISSFIDDISTKLLNIFKKQKRKSIRCGLDSIHILNKEPIIPIFTEERIITSNKAGLDIVTNKDITIETFIKNSIKHEFPNHSILSEEAGEEKRDINHMWIIDPIDGTINFASGLPLFAISIAYLEKNNVLFGRVILPKFKAIYKTEKNIGAYKNNKKLAVSDKKLKESVVSIVLSSHFSPQEIDETLMIIRLLAENIRGVRIIVSEALELAWIAEGILDGNICVKADIYGASAGKLLIEEAGGNVTNFSGENFLHNPKNIVASNGIIHEELLEIIRSSLTGRLRYSARNIPTYIPKTLLDNRITSKNNSR